MAQKKQMEAKMLTQVEDSDMIAEGFSEVASKLRGALYPSSSAETSATSAKPSSLSSAAASSSSIEETAPHELLPPQSIRCVDTLDSFEQNLHRIAYQVYSDQSLNDAQYLFISQYKSNGTLKSELLYTASKILSKPCLINNEKITVELFLSSITNNMNSFANSCLSASVIEIINQQRPMENKGMNDECSMILDRLTENLTDSEDLNLAILKLKMELAEKGMTRSEQYIMLSILSKVVDNFSLWREDCCESETT